ncbi:MAG TPA: hypothetical protein DD714_01675 [Candidatus Omnitrophica bacterium]|nr:hypothetical protein [Candidatus Omnitrophota bacterium]
MGSNAIRQQFADTMLAVGQEDPNLVVLIGDISHFLLQPFAKACPDRFYNIGICEPTIVSMAAGLAKTGFFPVVHTIAPFIIDRAFEQLKLDFCYQGLGGTLITVGSAFDYSNLGCTHHCYDDFALLKALPNTQVIFPASAVEFDVLFRQTYRNGLLTLFRLPAHLHGQTFSREAISIGKGLRLTEGTTLTLITTGPQLRSALAAQEPLRAMGWDPEILYLHTVRPLDTELIRESVSKTGCVLVIEEHSWSGGLGDDVLRATHDLGGIQYASLSIPDAFVRDYGTYEEHCEALGLSRDGILRTVASRFALKKEVMR